MGSTGTSARPGLPSALRLFVLQTTTTTTKRRTDVGSLCRGPWLFVYVLAGLMASALRARRIYFSPSVPAPPSRSESFEHLTFMEYLEISVFSLPLPSAAGNRAIVPVRHPQSDSPGLLSTGTSDFRGRDVAMGNLFRTLVIHSRVARVIAVPMNFSLRSVLL